MLDLKCVYWTYFPSIFKEPWIWIKFINLNGEQKVPTSQSIPHLASRWLVFQLLPHQHKASVCILHLQNLPWILIFSPMDSIPLQKIQITTLMFVLLHICIYTHHDYNKDGKVAASYYYHFSFSVLHIMWEWLTLAKRSLPTSGSPSLCITNVRFLSWSKTAIISEELR